MLISYLNAIKATLIFTIFDANSMKDGRWEVALRNLYFSAIEEFKHAIIFPGQQNLRWLMSSVIFLSFKGGFFPNSLSTVQNNYCDRHIDICVYRERVSSLSIQKVSVFFHIQKFFAKNFQTLSTIELYT